MALKRDSKGRFLKRASKKAKRSASKSKSPSRKKRSGLRGHKPGCKCVIHARKRRASKRTVRANKTRRVQRRAVAKRPVRARRPAARKGAVAIRLSKSEASSFRQGGSKIRQKVQLRAASLLRTHTTVRVTGPTGKAIANITR